MTRLIVSTLLLAVGVRKASRFLEDHRASAALARDIAQVRETERHKSLTWATKVRAKEQMHYQDFHERLWERENGWAGL